MSQKYSRIAGAPYAFVNDLSSMSQWYCKSNITILTNLKWFLVLVWDGQCKTRENGHSAIKQSCSPSQSKFLINVYRTAKGIRNNLYSHLSKSSFSLPALMTPCTPVLRMHSSTSLRHWMFPFANTGMFTAFLYQWIKQIHKIGNQSQPRNSPPVTQICLLFNATVYSV